MPNIAAMLREEITRLARKEARKQVEALRKASSQYRADIAELKRQVARIGQRTARVDKAVFTSAARPAPAAASGKVRFVAKGLRSQRERLGLSAAEYARLAGVSQQSIYNWELGTTRPRAEQIATLASLRRLGVKEARARLERLGA